MGIRVGLVACAAGVLALCAPADASLGEGQDFFAEAQQFYRQVACGGTAAVADEADNQILLDHCKQLQPKIAAFRKRYVQKAARFLRKLRPGKLPKTVVYPFGGGDLVSALLTFPEATEFTTISLEHPGDPRRLANLSGEELDTNLQLFREAVSGLLKHHDSSSENLRKMEKGPLPGQLSFFMLGLMIHDFEPVGLRYFTINADGTLHYLSAAEIRDMDEQKADRLHRKWIDTDFSVAFRGMELSFRERGQPNATPRIHRHIAANLANKQLVGSPLLAHLKKKGKVSAMTKAASYLLWSRKFGEIRRYLLRNMSFMISDSTGIPPHWAKRSGFRQITYGTFTGSYLKARKTTNDEFVALWDSQIKRRLSFRYGYPDASGKYHLMVTRR